MPVAVIDLFSDYVLFMNHWEGSSTSVDHRRGGYDPAVTTINSVRVHVACRKAGYAPLIAPWAWRELPTCEEAPAVNVVPVTNGVDVFRKPIHVDKVLSGEAKHLISTKENVFSFHMYKTTWFNDAKVNCLFNVWMEVDYSGTTPPLVEEMLPPPSPPPYPPLPPNPPNPPPPWTSTTFMADFSPLFMIVIVVMVLVLIITAIRRS